MPSNFFSGSNSPLLRLFVRCAVLACLGLFLSCSARTLPGDYGTLITFDDGAESNATADPTQLSSIQLTRADGTRVSLPELGDGKNILLVITRGLVRSADVDESGKYLKSFCSYCSTQTSRLSVNYPEFKRRNTEVVLVFPVARQEDAAEIQTFSAKVQGEGRTTSDFPFPFVLDIELVGVDALGIRDDLSKPATYILDSQGQVRFAYIGKSMSDRPSIKALLKQLDQINE